MINIETIFNNKKRVSIVIRNSAISLPGIHFFTNKNAPLQFAIHSHIATKETKIHSNNLTRPIKVKSKHKFIYIIKGKATVSLINNYGKIIDDVKLTRGDSIIIMNINHKLIFKPGTQAIEIKQGPYSAINDLWSNKNY